MSLSVAEGMRMGDLCRHSGLDRQLIHYYLKRGYLHPPLYKEGNRAFYDQTHLEKLLFLMENRRKGISLSYSAKLWKKETSGRKTSTKRSRRSEDASPSRKLIMEAATRLFLEKGYRSTTISEIMERVGITKPAFYYYFENKKDLYFSCIDNIFHNTFAKALEEIREEQDLLSRLKKRWEASFAFLPEMLTFLQLIKNSLQEGDEEHRRKAAEILQKAVIDPLVGDLNKGIESGVIRPVDSEISVFAMISVLEIVSYRPMINNKYSDDRIYHAIIDTIFNGLMA